MRRDRDVQKFVDATRVLTTPAELALVLRDITLDMGFDFFALIQHVDLSNADRSLIHMSRGEMIAVSNYPRQWSQTYISENLVASDPVVIACSRTSERFRWDELSKLVPGEAAQAFLSRAKSIAGIGAGFTVPCIFPNEPEGSASFSVRTGARLPDGNLRTADLVGRIAFQAARTLVLKARQLQSMAFSPRLTERQLQCTVLAGQGLTEAEIAVRLGIATETVKCHLRDARAAYAVTKTIQLVVRLLQDGHITVSDLAADQPHRSGGE